MMELFLYTNYKELLIGYKTVFSTNASTWHSQREDERLRLIRVGWVKKKKKEITFNFKPVSKCGVLQSEEVW